MPRLLCLLACLLLAFPLTAPARAECQGQSIFDDLSAEQLAEIDTATRAAPFATGNFWQATRGDDVIIIAGTYHLEDPRHAANLLALSPFIRQATSVLVEAGPKDTSALKTLLAQDPSKIVIQDGPTLNVALPPDVWSGLVKALGDRGVPAFMAAKFRPWYVIALLSVPPCALAEMQHEPRGLDTLVIETASEAGIPVQGLEPFDTVLRIFDQFSDAQMVSMIQSTLALEYLAEDQAATLADSYFAGQSRRIWELTRVMSYDQPGYTRAEVDAEFATMDKILVSDRNRSWIPVLIEAASHGPVFTAFGAMHLSGEAGVLNLLQAEGFEIKPLTLP